MAAAAALGEQIEVRPLGVASASGPAAEADALELVRLRTPLPRRSVLALERQRTLTPFVGRQTELALLEQSWERARDRRGQVVGIVGEPGVGKSRLLREACLRLAEAGALVVTGECASYAQATPYLPIASLVRQLAQVAEGDDRDRQVQRMATLLDTLGLDGAAHAAPLVDALSLGAGAADVPEGAPEADPQALRARLFGVLEQLFVRLSDQRPVLLAVEDLHWIDATSHDLLEALVRASSGASLMVLATYRPGYRPPWIGLSYATQQSLQPLGARESLALIRQAGSGAALPAALVHGILRRGEGNPLFLEELTWAAVERGEVGNGVEVPATVQTVIAARIDRLSADEKHLLQVAAAVGREAPERLLRAAATLPSEAVGPALATLRHNEWLFASQRGEELWHTFKHALTQDVAYQSQLTGARKALHLRIAAALEQHCPELVATQPELLAQHLTRAEASARAIVYWQHAGERAMERSANVEAAEHLNRALDLLGALPPSEDRDRQELALQVKLWPPLAMTRGYAAPDVGNACQRVRDLSVPLGKAPPLFSEFALRLVAGDLSRAHEAADELLRLGRS